MSIGHSLANAPYAAAAEEVIRSLGTDANSGLSSDEAAQRLDRYGRNELAQAPREPGWRRLGRQFADLLIWILIAAAVISGALGEWLDAIAILAIVVLNGLLGFVQEGRAEQALAALRKLSSPPRKLYVTDAHRTWLRKNSCPATGSTSRPATASRPTCGSSAPPACASRRPR